jgi:hypothetical protein
MYGHLYEDAVGGSTSITISDADTYVGWKSATAGQLSGVTADTSDATADHLTIPAGGGGDYLVSFQCTLNIASGTNASLQAAVHVDGTEKSEVTALTFVSSTTDNDTMSATGILSLSATEEVSLRVKNRTGTENLAISVGALSIYRISG